MCCAALKCSVMVVLHVHTRSVAVDGTEVVHHVSKILGCLWVYPLLCLHGCRENTVVCCQRFKVSLVPVVTQGNLLYLYTELANAKVTSDIRIVNARKR